MRHLSLAAALALGLGCAQTRSIEPRASEVAGDGGGFGDSVLPADVEYTAWSECPCVARDTCALDDPKLACLFDGLANCQPVMGGVLQTMGSAFVRVMAVRNGTCIFRFFDECEAGAALRECQRPIPVEPWQVLLDANGCVSDADISGQCTTLTTCNMIPESSAPCTTDDLADSCFTATVSGVGCP